MKARRLKGGRIKLTFEDGDGEVKAHLLGSGDDDTTLTAITLSEAVKLIVDSVDSRVGI